MRLVPALLALAASGPVARAAPASHAKGAALAPLSDVGATVAPGVDSKALAKEDSQHEAAGAAPRFAVPNEVVVDATEEAWETIVDGTQVWRHRVKAGAGCTSLNFGFGAYEMPKGGKLWITDLNGKSLLRRPFTAENNGLGELWTPIVQSCSVIIEANLPAKTEVDKLQLALTSVNVGYRGFGSGVGTKSGACNVDVVCTGADDPDYARIDLWRDEIPSVAVISTGGGTFCTGSMLNNAREDGTPYFLTAYHCGIREYNAASLVTYWDYKTSECQGTPDGELDNFLTGSTLLAENSASDMTLVQLTEDVPDGWLADRILGFAGWDRSGDDATSAVAIHHPSTDEKRISFEFDSTATSGYGGGPGTGTTHVRVADWDIGTTEPGSSGSPLFNQDYRVIGQLHGGGAACGNNAPDWYGKFSVSWDSAGLAQWLDPDGTGVDFVDTLGAGPPPPPIPAPTPPPTPAPTPCDTGVVVRVELVTDEYPGETSWNIVDSCQAHNAIVSERPQGYFTQESTEYSDEMCLPAAEYTFTIFDSYGDGICCGYGSGSYAVFYEGKLEGEGGRFGQSESHTFGSCDTVPPTVTYRSDARTCVPMDKGLCQEVASGQGKTFQEISESNWPGGCVVSVDVADTVFYNSAVYVGTRCNEFQQCVCQNINLEPQACASPTLTEAACEDAAITAGLGATYRVINNGNRPRGCYGYRNNGSSNVAYNQFNEDENGTGCGRGTPCLCEAS